MEMFDVVDENGIPTGEVIDRKTAHDKGIRHRTAHVWIVRKTDTGVQVLLQKRSANKDSFPGQYDTSSAGHIPAGDEPLDSALRELKEELGIDASPGQLKPAGFFYVNYEEEFHGKMFRDNEYANVFVYEGEVDASRLMLQEEEVERVDWFDVEELDRGIKTDDPRFCVPPGGFLVVKDYIEKNIK